MHDAVEERIGDRRISHGVVPALDGQLNGDDCRARPLSVVEDLQHVASLLFTKRREAPVIEHKDVDLRETAEQSRVRAVGVRKRELFDEPRHAAIQDAMTVRHACCARAHVTYDIPVPVAPVMMTLAWERSQAHVAS